MGLVCKCLAITTHLTEWISEKRKKRDRREMCQFEFNRSSSQRNYLEWNCVWQRAKRFVATCCLNSHTHTWISSQSEQKYNCVVTCISDINFHIQNALQKQLMIEACDNKYFKIKLEQGTEGSIVPSLPGIVIYLPRCHFLVMTGNLRDIKRLEFKKKFGFKGLNPWQTG